MDYFERKNFYSSIKRLHSTMDINKNLYILNDFILNNRFERFEKLRIIQIAKVSLDLEELVDNLKWEYDSVNIK